MTESAGTLSITLPPGIHAEILSGTNVDSVPVKRAVVWADRLIRACPQCKKPAARNSGCPAVVGDHGQLESVSQRCASLNGTCGEWLSVLYWAADDTSDAAIAAAAAELAGRRDRELAGERERIAGRLGGAIGDALTALGRGDDLASVITGSDADPGIYADGGGLVAWDYDPFDDDATITVAADIPGWALAGRETAEGERDLDVMSIEAARPVLGELADRARLAGETTLITRNGKPAVMIVPVPPGSVCDDTSRDPRDWTDQALTAAHIGYGYGGHEQVDAEFWRRNPVLHGFRNAGTHLSRCHYQEWCAAYPEGDPLGPGSGYEPHPGGLRLQQAYRDAVGRLAESLA
jgi:antitoxin (DNA-binding transcriptional repressor) of toxin-antitoxin stability system